MRKKLTLLFFVFTLNSFSQELIDYLQRAEELPIKTIEIKNIVKFESASFLTFQKKTELMQIEEYNFKEGLLQNIKVYSENKELIKEEIYFYNENNELIKIKFFESMSVFRDYEIWEDVLEIMKNKKNQIIQIRYINTKENKGDIIKKFSSYSNNDKDYVLDRTSYMFGGSVDNDGSYKQKLIYKDGHKIKYENLRTSKVIEYFYDNDGILIKTSDKKFFDAKDIRGNVIKRHKGINLTIVSDFNKITYLDGTVTGSLELDVNFLK